MKWMLITMMLANPVVYTDEATCEVARMRLADMDQQATCIPAGQTVSESDALFDRFFNMVEKMHSLEQNKSVDKSGN